MAKKWTYKDKKNLARGFRKLPTSSEKILWHCLKNRLFLGLKFRRQHGIDGFVLDFYCHELKLAVEVDGSVHWQAQQQEYDAKRQEIIEQHDIQFFRVNGSEVEKDVELVLDKIEGFIRKNYPFTY